MPERRSKGYTLRPEEIAAACFLHGESIPDWSPDWPMIGDLQRKGAVRVEVHNRWTATIWARLPVIDKGRRLYAED